MADTSRIEWTDATWNPITGCNKVSPGCKHCYAERLSLRLQAMGSPKYSEGFSLRLHEAVLQAPLSWRQPRFIFVNSMSDLFHEDVPLDFIGSVVHVMRRAHWHVFQVLTKRSQRLKLLNGYVDWPANAWLGVSVESEDYLWRIDDLRAAQARIRFLSLEPLLGPIRNLNLNGIHWVIVGGESGPGARPMNEDWVTDIRDQCTHANVPFFFKQWGGANKKATGRVLGGRTWDEMPVPIPA